MNSLRAPGSLNRTIVAALAILVLLFSASFAVVQADGHDPNIDTAHRDDVIPPDDDGGGASGAVDDGAGLDPDLDTAQRDDVVPEDDDGGASGTVGGRSAGLDPDHDTAQRDDVVPEDDAGGASGTAGGRSAGLDPYHDTAQRDDVVPEDDDGGASGTAGDGTEPPPGVDTAERDDVVPDDAGGARGSSTTAPAPTGLRVTSDTKDSVSLSWTAVTHAARYKMEYKRSSSSTWLHATYVSGTTATVDDLDCNAGYDFRVRARGDGVPYSYSYGDPSDSVAETTDKCNAPAPTGLRVTSDTDDSVSLRWNAVTDAAVYKIEYKRSTSSNWLHADYAFSGTTETIDELDCYTGYDFRVRARGDGIPYSTIYGDPSDSVSETTDQCVAPAPTGLRVTSDTEDSVSLRWTAVDHAAMYKVEYKRSTSSNWLHATYTSGTTATVDDLDPNTGYDFRVRARGDGIPYSYAYGDPSDSVSETTDLPVVTPPTGLRATSDTEEAVSLRWNSATGAALYKVEYKRSTSSNWLHATYTSGTTATVDDLDPNTGYDFRVRARGNGSTHSTTYSNPSTPVSETTDPSVIDAPTGLRVTSHTDDSVSLRWPSVDHAAMYKVEYKRSTSSSWLHATYTSGMTATVDELDPDTGYDFRVRARGDGIPYSTIYSDPSDSVSETTDERVFLPPTGLTLSIEPNDANDLDLAYTRSTGSTHYYQFALERSHNRYGSYSAAGSPVNDSSSPADFDDKDQGYWYRAHGRNCATSDRTECGDWSDWSDSIWVPDPAWTAFAFTPGPLALGGTSNVWTVPSRANNGVYVDLEFAEGAAKNPGAGMINVQVLGTNGEGQTTRSMNDEHDVGSVGASAGSRVRVTVDNNAFDLQYSLVTLTFHSGIDATGLTLARATVQKERQPSAPVSGDWSVDSTAGSLTLSWEAGPARLGAQPHHYEVEIPDPSNTDTLLYSERNVAGTRHVIDNLMTRGLEGVHTARVSHCNAAGGCSDELPIGYTTNPEDYKVPWIDVSDEGVVTWGTPNATPDKYRVQIWKSDLMELAEERIHNTPVAGSANQFQISSVAPGYPYRILITAQRTVDDTTTDIPNTSVTKHWQHEFGDSYTPDPAKPGDCGHTVAMDPFPLPAPATEAYKHDITAAVYANLGPVLPEFPSDDDDDDDDLGYSSIWCIYGGVTVESEPGADAIHVDGELHIEYPSLLSLALGYNLPEDSEADEDWSGLCPADKNCTGGFWYGPVRHVPTNPFWELIDTPVAYARVSVSVAQPDGGSPYIRTVTSLGFEMH